MEFWPKANLFRDETRCYALLVAKHHRNSIEKLLSSATHPICLELRKRFCQFPPQTLPLDKDNSSCSWVLAVWTATVQRSTSDPKKRTGPNLQDLTEQMSRSNRMTQNTHATAYETAYDPHYPALTGYSGMHSMHSMHSTLFDTLRHRSFDIVRLGFDVAQLSNDVEDLGPKAAQALPLLALLAAGRSVIRAVCRTFVEHCVAIHWISSALLNSNRTAMKKCSVVAYSVQPGDRMSKSQRPPCFTVINWYYSTIQ